MVIAQTDPLLRVFSMPFAFGMSGTLRFRRTLAPGDRLLPIVYGLPRSDPMISLSNLHKVFRQGDTEIRPLAGITLDVPAAQLVPAARPPRSRNSTLLHLAPRP